MRFLFGETEVLLLLLLLYYFMKEVTPSAKAGINGEPCTGYCTHTQSSGLYVFLTSVQNGTKLCVYSSVAVEPPLYWKAFSENAATYQYSILQTVSRSYQAITFL